MRARPRPDRDDEERRPDGDVPDELQRADQLAALKEQALERGFAPAKPEARDADVRSEQIIAYLQEWLEAPTLRGRLRRSGLLVRLDDE